MQPDHTVTREDSQSPPRSDGVAHSVAPIPRHHDGGGDRAVFSDDVPQGDLRPGGKNWNPQDSEAERKAAFEAKVAKARAYYDNHDLSAEIAASQLVEETEDMGLYEQATDEDLSAFLDQVAAADAKHGKLVPDTGPVVKAVRRGKRPSGSKVAIPEPAPPPEPEPEPETPKKKKVARQIEEISDEDLLAEAGVQPFYSTTEAAQFFDKTNQWLYWGLRKDPDTGLPIFIHPDGTPIEPERINGKGDGVRRFTLPIIRDILLSNYRRGNVEPDELKKILRRIRINEFGGEWREREGWHRVRGKWVHPSKLEKRAGKWVKKKDITDGED
jgi:hypothetical protein